MYTSSGFNCAGIYHVCTYLILHTHSLLLLSLSCLVEEGLSGGGRGHSGPGGGWWVPWNREEDWQVWRVPSGLL